MKLVIGSGTPIDCAEVEVDGPVIKAYGPGKMKSVRGPLLVAYHLHPGESLRGDFKTGEAIYAINS